MINQEELAQIIQAGEGTTLELSNYIKIIGDGSLT